MPTPTTHPLAPNVPKATGRLYTRIKAILPPGWLGMLVGLLLLIYGQGFMESLTTQGKNWTKLWDWSRQHHLDIVNLENAIWGSILITAGGLLCASLCSSKKWEGKKASATPAPEKTSAQKTDFSLFPLVIPIGLYALLISLLAKHHYSLFLIILWLLSLATAAHLAWQKDLQTGRRLNPRITLQDATWLLLLLATGVAIGSFLLEDIPNQLIPDEGSFWETASAIARRQHLPPVWGPGVYTFPIASSYFQGWLMRIFGINLWGWRFSSVLAAVLTATPLYLLLHHWFDRQTAVTACLLLFSNPYFLAFARLGYNNAQALLTITLSLYLASLAIQKSSLFYYFLSGLASGLAAFTYPAAWLGTVIIVLTGLWMVIIRKRKPRRAIRAGLVLLSGWLMVVLREHFMTTGLTGGWMGLFFVVGFFLALRRLKEPRFWVPTLWVVSGIFFLGILAAFPPRHTHLVAILPAFSALSAIGFWAVAHTITEMFHLQKNQKHWLVVAGLALLMLTGLHQYFVVMPKKYLPSFEDIVSWNAWRTKTPATLYYIENEPNLHKVAYLADRKLTALSYHNLSTGDFLSNTIEAIRLQPAIVFYPQDTDGQITSRLLRTSPLFHSPVSFTDATGAVIGYATTNIQGLSLQPENNLIQGLRTLVQTPVIYLLSVLLAGIILINRKSLPTLSLAGVEFEFKIRIAIPKTESKDNHKKTEEQSK
ncbi:MAG: ArnT family glycosyltransferase [Candidatus Villigracilaceae bacterium]